MTNKRRLILLSSLTAAPAFAAPFLAIGDNAELFLTARTEARYEDNLTYSSSNEESDEVFEFVPGAELTFGKNSITKGSLAVYERFTAYSSNPDLNDSLANVLFKSNYDGAKLKLNTNASFRESNQNSRDTFGATLVSRNYTNAGVKGEYALTEKSKAALGVSYADTDYKTAGYADQESYSVPANYYFAINPKIDLSAGITYRESDVDAVGADSEDVYYNVGARGKFTSKLSGTFSVGLNTREYENGNDESGLGVNAGLAYDYSPKTMFTLDLVRDFETGADANGIENSSATVGARTSLTAALSASASLSYQQYDYLNINRSDDFIVASIGFAYTYSQNLSFDAAYSLSDNDSDVVSGAADFTANVFSIGANFRY
jgi:hypothetical protein